MKHQPIRKSEQEKFQNGGIKRKIAKLKQNSIFFFLVYFVSFRNFQMV